jgi:hypothetical protein
MPVTRAQAKEICTKQELELVESSFRPEVNRFTAARLRSKVERTRKLQDKFRELAQKQNRETKETEPGRQRAANQRTERKARLFEETRERFEKRLADVDATGGDEPGADGKTGRARSARATADKRRARRQAKQDLDSAAS